MKPLDSKSGAEGRGVIFLICKEKQKGNTGLHRENARAQRECKRMFMLSLGTRE
jgi:hypothetical protein